MEESEVPQEADPCKDDDDEFQKLLLTLPEEKIWNGSTDSSLYLFQGFWCPSILIKPILSFQRHFQPLDSDIILASSPKSGTTWLKALTFSILNRRHYTFKNSSPLLTSSPHDLVPFLEFDIYMNNDAPNLVLLPPPRIFSTHLPYQMLPSSVKESNCRIVCVCRGALDQLISYWEFSLKIFPEPFSLDETIEKFYRGVYLFGPVADHVLGYWKASMERPENVCFLRYEEMRGDIFSETKRLAEFLGCAFSGEEEKEGVVRGICDLCSFESLKNLDVNKTGKSPYGIPNPAFFRKGKVGDWVDYLSPSKAEYLENLMEEKLSGSDLTLKICPKFHNSDETKTKEDGEG